MARRADAQTPVELVGPIPRELEHYVSWSGAVSTNAAAPKVVHELIAFLNRAERSTRSQGPGMEPE
jgi:hypothetical protein